ncbi:hypothetical protein BK133_05125 [Paenibacillus sp. FSL H8-0548]|uniref:hypothetical protein n=1 Tax=Paenibacillus sp. FSL H8-0548 TaxID=1920422 RepID=UPI00096EBF20|nr:hypothetical protein [Paenibacillus sp. FSL H8-0548]OMF37439.1 hypothetical protein BK133_05125 [Paenibacillus sp. FSL H8-0548]
MPNRILTTETYHDEIRGRLGVGKEIISNTDIDAPSVLPIAESKVIKNVPNYTSLTDDNANYLYAAAICMVAATLAPSMTARIKKSKKDFDWAIENQLVDWQAASIKLIDEAFELIGMIEDGEGVQASVPVFGVSGPTRLDDSYKSR